MLNRGVYVCVCVCASGCTCACSVNYYTNPVLVLAPHSICRNIIVTHKKKNGKILGGCWGSGGTVTWAAVFIATGGICIGLSGLIELFRGVCVFGICADKLVQIWDLLVELYWQLLHVFSYNKERVFVFYRGFISKKMFYVEIRAYDSKIFSQFQFSSLCDVMLRKK